jgi:DNA-damage-inducible protein J
MNTKTASVRARIEPSVKKKAEVVLSKIGISPSEAINVFYRRIALDKGIPFSLHVPNAETRAAIRALESGKGKTVSFDEFATEMLNVARRV